MMPPDYQDALEDLSPLDVFESASEIAAFVYAKFGGSALRQAFETADVDQEFLDRAAEELAAIGLGKVAAIVSSIAADKPPGSANDRGRKLRRN
jgi:hypothetical protein